MVFLLVRDKKFVKNVKKDAGAAAYHPPEKRVMADIAKACFFAALVEQQRSKAKTTFGVGFKLLQYLTRREIIIVRGQSYVSRLPKY
jgi:hypothetical protein